MVDGRNPSKTDVRDGLQTGAWQWALINRVPLLASLSKLGVLTCGCPPNKEDSKKDWELHKVKKELDKDHAGTIAPCSRNSA